MAPDRVLFGANRRRNHLIFAAAFWSTVALSIALVVTVWLLRDAQIDNEQLQDQITAGNSEQTCRTRFANEDERVDRARSNWIVAALTALAEEDDEGLLLSAENASNLARASAQASAERTRAPEICARDPAAEPTSHTIPEFPN